MVYFKEEQRFTQWWLILLVVSSSALALGLLIEKLIFDQNVNSDLWDTLILLGVVVLIFTSAYALLTAKLEVEIKDRSIYYRYKPFIWNQRKIRVEEIAEYNVRRYDPISEYGGWGYRFGFGKGKAFNVKGDMGLQLKLKNGKKLLLGTQKPEEMETVMKEMMNRKSEDYG